jgi:hypothetical protein
LLFPAVNFCYILSMGEIKSALELALERTASIPSDREALRRHEAQNDGKRIFARVRDGEDVDVAAELAGHPAEARAWVRQGLFEVARRCQAPRYLFMNQGI